MTSASLLSDFLLHCFFIFANLFFSVLLFLLPPFLPLSFLFVTNTLQMTISTRKKDAACASLFGTDMARAYHFSMFSYRNSLCYDSMTYQNGMHIPKRYAHTMGMHTKTVWAYRFSMHAFCNSIPLWYAHTFLTSVPFFQAYQ